MVQNPCAVPMHVIDALIHSNSSNVYSFNALQFAFTCPWIESDTIQALMGGKVDDHDDDDGESDDERPIGGARRLQVQNVRNNNNEDNNSDDEDMKMELQDNFLDFFSDSEEEEEEEDESDDDDDDDDESDSTRSDDEEGDNDMMDINEAENDGNRDPNNFRRSRSRSRNRSRNQNMNRNQNPNQNVQDGNQIENQNEHENEIGTDNETQNEIPIEARQIVEEAANQIINRAKLKSICTNILHMLFKPDDNLPPRYDAVKVMLECMPSVLEVQDSSDHDLPLHSACWSDTNAKYIELFVRTAMKVDDPAFLYGGLLESNEFGISPLELIVQKWEDDRGAAMIELLVKAADMSDGTIASSMILHEAVSHQKWAMVKTIIRLSPVSLSQVGSMGKLPIHSVCTTRRTTAPDVASTLLATVMTTTVSCPKMEIVQLMVEQGILNSSDEDPGICGGLIAKDWNGKTPLQLLYSLRLFINNTYNNSHDGNSNNIIHDMNNNNNDNNNNNSAANNNNGNGNVGNDTATRTNHNDANNGPNQNRNGNTSSNQNTNNNTNGTNSSNGNGNDSNTKVDVIMDFVKGILHFITMEKFKNDTACLGAIIHEAIRIKAWNIVQYMVETYPQSLLMKDKSDNLPLHSICKTDAPFDMIKLVIEAGAKQKFGSSQKKNYRAGLLEANKDGERSLQLIAGRKCSSNGKVLRFLQDFKPKLITKKDIKDLNLLHKVADSGRPAVARVLLKCVPKAISIQDEDGNLPLHIACKCKSNAINRELMSLLLDAGIKEKVGGPEGFGGLFVKNNKDMTPMDLALKNVDLGNCGYGVRKWACISALMKRAPEAPILQSSLNLGFDKRNLEFLVEKFPECLSVKDSNGQLPIHLALTKGRSQYLGLDAIIEAYPPGLNEFDPVSGLLPFALAASSRQYNLAFIYKIMQKSPSFLSSKRWTQKTMQLCITKFLEEKDD